MFSFMVVSIPIGIHVNLFGEILNSTVQNDKDNRRA